MADYLITVTDEKGDFESVVELVRDADSVKRAFEMSVVDYADLIGIRIYRIADGPKFVSFEQVTETRMRVETS